MHADLKIYVGRQKFAGFGIGLKDPTNKQLTSYHKTLSLKQTVSFSSEQAAVKSKNIRLEVINQYKMTFKLQRYRQHNYKIINK